jgi:hypothetical protein
MPGGRHLSRGEIRDAAVDCGILAAACLITYWLATRALAHVYLLSRDDALVGGVWAVIATIFVLRDSYRRSRRPQHPAWGHHRQLRPRPDLT